MDTVSPPARVAFLGLGVMGAAMAANVAKAGFALAVHNRSRGKAEGQVHAFDDMGVGLVIGKEDCLLLGHRVLHL